MSVVDTNLLRSLWIQGQRLSSHIAERGEREGGRFSRL